MYCHDSASGSTAGMLPTDGREFDLQDLGHVCSVERGELLATAILDRGFDPLEATLVLRGAAQFIADRTTTEFHTTRARKLEPDEAQAARKARPRYGVIAERITTVRGDRR